jgi:BirA family biotin operon repressor/biotin-[acetyl-CoA-carboxylase] ligase
MYASEVASALAGTRWGPVEGYDEVGSTNAVVMERARAGAPEGLVVVADHQRAGRGRFDRRWEAPAGTNLLLSVLLRPAELALERWHLVVAAVSLAAAEACAAVAGVFPLLKWPNDLLVEDRKLAGVLAESEGGAVVVGLGLNVGWAPEGAASLDQAAGHHVDRTALLVALLEALDRLVGAWDEVGRRYPAVCGTVGRRVRVMRPGGDLVGRADEVDPVGHLVVVDDHGRRHVVSAGDVTHLRPDPLA